MRLSAADSVGAELLTGDPVAAAANIASGP
jgi:hypothetical protein